MKPLATSDRRSMRQIFQAPIGLACLILFGLFSALLGQGGLWFFLSWFALAIPILLAVNFAFRSRD